ncbi:TPA: glucosaminyl-a1,3-N,N'-diacetylbacillosaminyl-a1-diphospho-di-trans,octa-cis-undecaprenol synthase PglH, partial [Neisseria meningitidis]
KVPHKLLPFASRANRAYRCADALVAVSQTYLDRAKEANPNVPGEAVYIGTDFAAIAPPRFRSKTTRLFYLGTLSYSYDVETVCKGVRKLLDDGENVELHIMGGGPDLEKLKQYENRAIKFYGYLPYSEMMSIAKGCDIAVNAIHSHAMQSVTNKLSDYMALQKPILNSQTNAEVLSLLNLLPHENYRSGDVDSFVQAAKDILKRKNDPVQSDEIVRRFRRDISYRKIVNLIERLANE